VSSLAGPAVVFVGAGPGDPGLLTVRGQRALADAQVVVFDAAVPAALVDGAPDGAERVRVAAGPEAAGGVLPAAVPGLLVARAAAGLRVVRLLPGDAGDFGAEALALADAGVGFEVVPGIGPAGAAAGYAGIPVRDARLGPRTMVLEAVDAAQLPGLDWPRVAAVADTLLVRVTATTLPAVVDALVGAGRSRQAPAAAIARPGTFEQRTVTGPLGELPARLPAAGLTVPAVLVVGEVVGLRPRLGWLECRPLFGRRVVITRPRHQAARFASLLEAFGAEVVALPAIRLEPPDDFGPLDGAIAALSRFAWVIFTSANGVAAFGDRLTGAGRDARALGGARLAAIGPETGEALRRLGLSADLVPAEYRAEGLVEALRPHVAAGAEVLLVRAAEARDVVPRELGALGIRVTIAPAYRTRPAKEGADHVVGLLEAGRVDVVTFTSSSTVRGFMALLSPEERPRLLGGLALAAIGPITAGTLEEYGLPARIVPTEYTIPALAAAIAAHFAAPGTAT
jgi:uroporphyrinogen III methyltransferase/synthase